MKNTYKYIFCECCGIKKSVGNYSTIPKKSYIVNRPIRHAKTCRTCKDNPKNMLIAKILYLFIKGRYSMTEIAEKAKTSQTCVQNIVTMYLDTSTPKHLKIEADHD